MASALPKLDRAAFVKELLVEAERTVNEVADAVDNAPAGRLIRDSEERARERSTGSGKSSTNGPCRPEWMRRKPLFPPPVSAATGKPKRHKGRQAYSVLTINGRVRVRRVRWHCPREGSEAPLDALVDEAETTISQGVREMACRVNQDASSFDKAAANLRRTAAYRGQQRDAPRTGGKRRPRGAVGDAASRVDPRLDGGRLHDRPADHAAVPRLRRGESAAGDRH